MRTYVIPELTEHQRKVLLHVADAIEQHEDRFDMAQWYDWGRITEARVIVRTLDDVVDDDDPPYELVHGRLAEHCGTAGCIAGWIVSEFVPADIFISEHDVANQAIELLKIPDDEYGYKPTEPLEFFSALFTDQEFWTALGYLDQDDLLGTLTAQSAAKGLREIVDNAGREYIYQRTN